MDKCCSNENPGTEMLAKEENLRRDLHPPNLLCNYRKSTSFKLSDSNAELGQVETYLLCYFQERELTKSV